MQKRTRKRYWIDRQIQGALAARVAIHWLVFASIAAILTLMLHYIANPLAPLSEQRNVVWQNQGPFAIVILILLPIFVFDTVKLSNRFAGPVLRLRRIMSSIADGSPPERIVFRDNDFWRGMANDFNALVDKGFFDNAEEITNGFHRESQSVIEPRDTTPALEPMEVG